MSDYRVSVVSPEEAAALMARLRAGGVENQNARRTAVVQGGLEMKGSFELVARDVESGDVAWTHKDENLITDFGRRAWMDGRFATLQLGFAASTELPSAGRCSLSGDVTQIFTTGNLNPSNNSVTNTKTLSTTFTTPASNRTLGTIWLQRLNENINAAGYVHGLIAYALLTPPKTQTTTQTLEVVYKISMTPIY
jgi:hypothetical protein